MSKNNLFEPKIKIYPQIYASSINELYPDCLKIGYTARKNVKRRINEQFKIEFPEGKKPYKVEFVDSAVKENGEIFSDTDVHDYLEAKGVECVGGEWYRCTVDDVIAAMLAIKKGIKNTESRTQTFKMRPEQEDYDNIFLIFK